MDLEVIRRILVEAKTTGVEQTTAQLKGLSSGYDGVTVASQKTETATESVARKFASLEARLDPASRAAQNLAKDIATLDAQLAQTGNVERHAQLLEVASQNAIKMSGGAKAATGVMEGFKQTLSGVSGQLVGMAAGMGPIGIFLSALGPWGIAAAAGLTLISGAIDKINETATTAGQKARNLVELSEATKLSINELRGLKQAAAAQGVDEDKLESWLNKATIAMEKAKTGTGEVADALRAIDPAFITALRNAGSFAAELDVVARAAATAKAQGKDVAIFYRDIFGRGAGGRADLMMQATQAAGGIAAVGEAMKKYGGAAEEEIKHRAELSEQNTKYAKEAEALNATLLRSTKVLELQQVALKATISIKKQLIEVEKQYVEAGMSSAQAEAKATRDIASPEIVQRAQDKARYTGPARAPQEYGPPKPPGFIPGATEAEALALGKLQDAAIQTMFAVDGLTEAQRNFNDQAVKLTALGPAVTSAERFAQAQDKIKISLQAGEFGVKDSAEALKLYDRAMAAAEVQGHALTNMHNAAIQTLRARTAAERQAAAAATVKASDASGDSAQRQAQAVEMEVEKQAQAHRDAMNAMQGQLQVAQAVTGAEQMAAQEAANYRDLIRQGRTAQQAAAEAAMQTKIAIAQVNSAAQQQLQSLRDQAATAGAVTGAEKMRAEAAATTNALLRQNVDATTASAVGAQQLANAQAAAGAAVESQTHSLRQQTELIYARMNGTEASVAAEQAYKNAIDSGADAIEAMNLKSAMLANSRAQAAEKEQQAAQQAAQQRQQAAQQEENALAQANKAVESQIISLQEQLALIEAGANGTEAETKAQIAYNQAIRSGADSMHAFALERATLALADAQAETANQAKRKSAGFIGILGHSAFDPSLAVGTPWFNQGVYDTQLRRLGLGPQPTAEQRRTEQTSTITNQFEMSRVEAQISGNKAAEIQAVQGELNFYRAQPRTLENLNQIKSLQDALKELTKATDDNTKSQDALSGLYSRQFGQGFYDGGAAVGELIYGLDNNTGGAIDAMQHANDNNTRDQNTLLTSLSQNQITTTAYYGGGMVSATGGVQGAVESGFSSLTYAVQHQTGTTPGTTTPGVRTPPGTSPAPIVPFYPHIPGTPGFARGGSFTTAGYGGDDSNVVAFRVSPQRERVTITPMNGGNGGGSSGTNNNISNNININVPQGTNEFRSTAMHIADEIFNQVAVAGRRR